ncbi:MAG: hypothetical protein A2176_14900 [Spirochaetes bacterium RBG_13_51_14]|nr:MAG: hypothetical protein A2176_14900 [Spirochaetes bacterium RBG_13_51_14]
MIERLLVHYSDDDFIQKTRATYLVWFLLIALPVMTLLSLVLYFINRDAKSFATIPGVGIGWLFAGIVLYLIRNSRYRQASITGDRHRASVRYK